MTNALQHRGKRRRWGREESGEMGMRSLSGVGAASHLDALPMLRGHRPGKRVHNCGADCEFALTWPAKCLEHKQALDPTNFALTHAAICIRCIAIPTYCRIRGKASESAQQDSVQKTPLCRRRLCLARLTRQGSFSSPKFLVGPPEDALPSRSATTLAHS